MRRTSILSEMLVTINTLGGIVRFKGIIPVAVGAVKSAISERVVA